jgi:hypothetical protein
MSEYCNFLQGVCVLQQAVSTHILSEKFYNPELVELIKNTGNVKIIPYDAQADETARVLITMRRGNISMGIKGGLTGGVHNNAYTPQLALRIIISTQSYFLTEKLGQELLQYVASIRGGLQAFNLNIGTITLSPTENNKEVSPNYFINSVDITASIPITMWKTQSSDDILSSIKTSITFNGQNILS